ncbi:MAG: M14 family metallocarboxypeptidase [Oscillospiraceae bacterium]|nr:M14 family metallocarboxypeptidase [Oscillospiraceae bacterium]
MSMVPVDVPMSAGLSEKVIRQLTERYPALTERVIASTAFGRPVQAMTIGRGERQVILVAAQHGNEWITAAVLLRFAEELAQAAENSGKIWGVEAETILKYATVHMIPMANPDGVALVTGEVPEGSGEWEQARNIAARFPSIPFPEGWKANLQGVDLNLQYPAGWLQAREIKFSQGFTRPAPRDFVGRAPLDQRESRALAEYTGAVDPALVLALHTQGEVIYWQFRDYEVAGARALAEEFARVSGYTAEETPYESSFAGYKDWFIQNWRRPGFTIECGKGENPLPLGQADKIYRDVLGILVTAVTGLPEAG